MMRPLTQKGSVSLSYSLSVCLKLRRLWVKGTWQTPLVISSGSVPLILTAILPTYYVTRNEISHSSLPTLLTTYPHSLCTINNENWIISLLLKNFSFPCHKQAYNITTLCLSLSALERVDRYCRNLIQNIMLPEANLSLCMLISYGQQPHNMEDLPSCEVKAKLAPLNMLNISSKHMQR